VAFERFSDGFPIAFRYILHDLSHPLLSLIRKQGYADHISCFFAIHYFMKNEETLKIFIENVSNALKDGGYFIGTTFDGDRVFEYLKDFCNGSKNNNGIYKIIKKYNDMIHNGNKNQFASFL